MKKRLYRFLITAFLTSVLLLAGCGKEDTRKAEEAELDSVSASLNGTLLKFTGTEVSIETQDNTKLTFKNCANAELELANGIVPGNQVLLVYVGSIDGSDTSKVRIRKIIVDEDNTGVLPQEDDNTVSGSAASGVIYSAAGQEEPASGVHVEKTNGTGKITGGVNVRADAKSGSQILGTLGSGDTVTVTGICENGWYRIVFEEETGFIWQDYISY